LLKRAIGVVASAFQLAGERGIVASRARGLRVGRASGGVVVGQPIDDVAGAAQEPVDYVGRSSTRASWAVFPTTATFDETRGRLTTATDLAQARSGPSVPPPSKGTDTSVGQDQDANPLQDLAQGRRGREADAEVHRRQELAQHAQDGRHAALQEGWRSIRAPLWPSLTIAGFDRSFDRFLVFGADASIYESPDPVWDETQVDPST
jgi:hypothetical protein